MLLRTGNGRSFQADAGLIQVISERAPVGRQSDTRFRAPSEHSSGAPAWDFHGFEGLSCNICLLWVSEERELAWVENRAHRAYRVPSPRSSLGCAIAIELR